MGMYEGACCSVAVPDEAFSRRDNMSGGHPRPSMAVGLSAEAIAQAPADLACDIGEPFSGHGVSLSQV